MTIDVTYFGYGLGPVMLGWLAGCAVGLLASAVRRGAGI